MNNLYYKLATTYEPKQKQKIVNDILCEYCYKKINPNFQHRYDIINNFKLENIKQAIDILFDMFLTRQDPLLKENVSSELITLLKHVRTLPSESIQESIQYYSKNINILNTLNAPSPMIFSWGKIGIQAVKKLYLQNPDNDALNFFFNIFADYAKAKEKEFKKLNDPNDILISSYNYTYSVKDLLSTLGFISPHKFPKEQTLIKAIKSIDYNKRFLQKEQIFFSETFTSSDKTEGFFDLSGELLFKYNILTPNMSNALKNLYSQKDSHLVSLNKTKPTINEFREFIRLNFEELKSYKIISDYMISYDIHSDIDDKLVDHKIHLSIPSPSPEKEYFITNILKHILNMNNIFQQSENLSKNNNYLNNLFLKDIREFYLNEVLQKNGEDKTVVHKKAKI